MRVEKNHEPVVSERDFAVVQKLLGMDTRTALDREGVYLLSGIAVCGDCGTPMVSQRRLLDGFIEGDAGLRRCRVLEFCEM